MSKKLVIVGVVLLLIIGGGIFLLSKQPRLRQGFGGQAKEQSGSDTIPTQWSQAGDYEIKEVAGPLGSEASQQTVVTNSKAGFSIAVPQGWKVEQDQLPNSDQFFIDMLSPDVVRGSVQPLQEGCGIGLDTFVQNDKWFLVDNSVKAHQIIPEETPKNESLVSFGKYFGVKTDLVAGDNRARDIFGDKYQVTIPIRDDGVIEFGMTVMPKHQEDCVQIFKEFLSRVTIE